MTRRRCLRLMQNASADVLGGWCSRPAPPQSVSASNCLDKVFGGRRATCLDAVMLL